MSALEMAAAEEERIFAFVESRAGGAADPVADLIADDGTKHDGKQQPFQRNNVCGGENAGGDEQGIAGKEKADEETGFDEDNGADQRGAASSN
jgi:hypothetical protein